MKRKNVLKLIGALIVFIVFYLNFNWGGYFFAFLMLHEIAHCITAYFLGYKIKEIIILPFGISANLKDDFISPLHNIFISIAGPLTNLIISLIFFLLYKLEGEYYLINMKINIVIFIFNLMPAGFLDGGRIMKSLLQLNFSFYLSEVIINLNGIIFGGIILLLALIVKGKLKSISMGIMGVYFIYFSIIEWKNKSMNILKMSLYKWNYIKDKRKYKIRCIGFKGNTKLFDIIKSLCFNRYYIFYIMDSYSNVFKLYEGDILYYYLKYGNIKVMECLNYNESNKP